MKIKMLKSMNGASNQIGSMTMQYIVGQEYIMADEWQKTIAQVFIDNDGAELVGGTIEKKVVAPTEIKRARKEDGTLQADDKSTPDVNEAWQGGKPPKKK